MAPSPVVCCRRYQRNRKDDGEAIGTMAQLRKAIGESALEAASTQIELLESPDPRVRLRAAGEILDRAGLKGKVR